MGKLFSLPETNANRLKKTLKELSSDMRFFRFLFSLDMSLVSRLKENPIGSCFLFSAIFLNCMKSCNDYSMQTFYGLCLNGFW